MGGYKSSVILCLRYQIPLYVYMQFSKYVLRQMITGDPC